MGVSDPKPTTVAIVAADGVLSSAIAGPFDLLSSAGYLWQVLNADPVWTRRFDVSVLAREKGPLRCYQGLTAFADKALGEMPNPDIAFVPTVFLPTLLEEPLGIPEAWRPIVSWLGTAYRSGSLICSNSSGALLLAEAGLLDGCAATIHWTLAERAQQKYPAVRFQPDRVLIPEGPGERIVTAGGGTCWQDLALYLIARFAGSVTAAQTAKSFTIFRKVRGQQPYAEWFPPRNHGDAAVARAQEALHSRFPDADVLSGAVAASGLTPRTFKRRFKAATGQSATDYIQHLRVKEARFRLETTNNSIEEIGARIGYRDVAFFRTLFRRLVGLTPGQYREQFGLLEYPGADPLDAIAESFDAEAAS
ncbi:MAG: helix-turn-helix domain-containing protein [Rhodospirillaceae bacterium]|nr:helix-turn-helix domain-containing protein [Rhodospirillaceae bacterium]